ncbi:MAG: undecaprenyl-phosphate glucose phosphotransferase [Methanomassiliicoccales archaeon]|nr:MAG: undecaprenyl-phosphate glucose phosphotransferase [Methanomassiliicoccales archaeon]
MLKKHSEFFVSLFFICELSILAFCWILSYCFRFHLKLFIPPLNVVPLSTYLYYLVIVLISWSIVSKVMKLYRPRRIDRGAREIADILKAVTVTVIIVICFTYATKRFEFSRLAYMYFWILSVGDLSIERMLLRKTLRRFRTKGYNLRSSLIIGSGPIVGRVINAIENHAELGIVINGIVTSKTKEIDGSTAGIPVVGFIDDLQDIIDSTPCDIVFVALPLEGHQYMGNVLRVLIGKMLDIKIIPDVYEYIALRGGLDTIDDIPLVGLQTSPLYGWNRVAKRSLDLMIATLSLVALSPVFVFIGILIKLTSRGPIFYMQERIGMDGRMFTMFKFRSMEVKAEEETGPVWASERDPRRTKVGALMRKLNLDELPQLINVLKGEMSLVGPRPERPVFVGKFRTHVAHYMLRHRIKAGMTGWAQVNGFRGNTSLEKRIEHDLFYIKHWSLWLDLKIILMTLWRGFKSAY